MCFEMAALDIETAELLLESFVAVVQPFCSVSDPLPPSSNCCAPK